MLKLKDKQNQVNQKQVQESMIYRNTNKTIKKVVAE